MSDALLILPGRWNLAIAGNLNKRKFSLLRFLENGTSLSIQLLLD